MAAPRGSRDVRDAKIETIDPNSDSCAKRIAAAADNAFRAGVTKTESALIEAMPSTRRIRSVAQKVLDEYGD